jgi:hypothetical protein
MLQDALAFAASFAALPDASAAEQARMLVYVQALLVGAAVTTLIALAKTARNRRLAAARARI